MRFAAIALAVVLATGCRGRAVTTHYAGFPVSVCEAGRAYAPPPATATTQPFIPLVAEASKSEPAPTAEVAPPPEPDKPAKPEKPAKKKPAKGKKDAP